MKPYRRVLLVALLALALSCNYITRRLAPAASPSATASATLTAVATEARPAYIPPDCEGVAIATIPAATELAQPTPAIRANPPISSEEQLRIFDKTVQTVSDVYVYPDFNGKDWNSITATHRLKIAGGLSTEDFYNEMQT